tara:strand:+ start:2769 stop:3011 length:243 start_codon:yes stop_codon:yes gene_type:complete
MTNKKEDWEIKRDKEIAEKQKAMGAMTVGQLQAVHDAYNAINTAMISIRDLSDLMLSDIKDLDEACYKLFDEFNMRGQDD